MLTEMAVADAYAIAWEFTDQQTGSVDFSRYYQHPTYAELRPGQFTDDTQRAIANANLLLQDLDHDKFNPMSYLSYLYIAYKSDPREGYSRNFQRLLKESNTPLEFMQNCRRTALSNGSVMGVAPLGYIKEVASLKLAASAQAMSTHHSATAVHAQLIALAAHFFIYNHGDKSDMVEFMAQNADWINDEEETSWRASVKAFNDDQKKKITIRAASVSAYVVHAIENFDCMTAIIRDVIARGGDTDSAAASAIAVASGCEEIDDDIPSTLYDQLDTESRYDLFELRNLDAALVQYSLDLSEQPQ